MRQVETTVGTDQTRTLEFGLQWVRQGRKKWDFWELGDPIPA